MGNWEAEVIVHHSSKFASVLLAVLGVPSVRILGGIRGREQRVEGGETEGTGPAQGRHCPPAEPPPPPSPAAGPPNSRGSESAASDPALWKEHVSVCKREERADGGVGKLFPTRARQ